MDTSELVKVLSKKSQCYLWYVRQGLGQSCTEKVCLLAWVFGDHHIKALKGMDGWIAETQSIMLSIREIEIVSTSQL